MRVATRSVVLPLPRKSSRSLRDASTILGLARLRDEKSLNPTSGQGSSHALTPVRLPYASRWDRLSVLNELFLRYTEPSYRPDEWIGLRAQVVTRGAVENASGGLHDTWNGLGAIGWWCA